MKKYIAPSLMVVNVENDDLLTITSLSVDATQKANHMDARRRDRHNKYAEDDFDTFEDDGFEE